jgi:uroporphyrinogen-III synthase
LKFTHCLITRPETEAVRLAALLSGAGLEVIVLPAYRFEPAVPGFDWTEAWRAAARKLAVFSSTRAVGFGLRQLPAGFLDAVEVAAIGPATADALEQAGHPVSIFPERGFTSEDLLDHPDLARNPGDALIFAAPGGRQALRKGLEAIGWRVRMAMVYRRAERVPPRAQAELVEQAGRLISVWTSASALQILRSALPAGAWRNICRGQCVVTSRRLRNKLMAAGADSVSVTDGPGNDAIRDLILQLI